MLPRLMTRRCLVHGAPCATGRQRHRRPGASSARLPLRHTSSDSPTTLDPNHSYKWENIHDEAESMMQASFVSYPLTFLLREAKRGKLQSSDRILDKLKAIGDGDLSTYIIADDILDIVANNHDYIRRNYGGEGEFDREFGWLSSFQDISAKARQSGDDPESISMLEFDDFHEQSRLVYGIALNKIQKRITVIFRGTYSDGTRDWRRNLQCVPHRVSMPRQVIDFGRDYIKLEKHMHIHQGFYEYMFNNKERGAGYELERAEEIMQNILSVCAVFPDYKLYITGHSLGGSLALLAAFHIALYDSPLIPKPISCVSVGSPRVGDENFQAAFRLLEEAGWIRYLRITNENDPVPHLPPFSWYRHVGMNLSLAQENGFQIRHPNGRNRRYGQVHDTDTYSLGKILSLFRSPTCARNAINAHYLSEYLRRLAREKDALRPVHLNDCYRDEGILLSGDK